jgi:hypothetical protein
MKHPVLLHLREHTWLWVAAFAALGVVMLLLRLATPGAFAFMVVGVLIMLKSQGTDILAIIAEDPVAAEDDAEASDAEGMAGRITEPVR